MFKLAANESQLEEMKLIDAVERLGLGYHFEEEIEEALLRMYESPIKPNYDNDVNFSALQFRKLKDDTGNFQATLISDWQGMLSLYEAAHLSVEGEGILDEAITFTNLNLNSMMANLSASDARQVQHALDLPLHKGIPRLEARHYISVYEEDRTRNETILELAKLDFNMLQKLHRQEIKELSRWWKDIDVASKFPFARDRLVESYYWALGVYFEPMYSFGRLLIAKLIAILTIVDDIYDIYGTSEELHLFTEAIERWDNGAIDRLPEYMRLCFQEVMDIFFETEDWMTREGNPNHLCYLIREMKALIKAYFVEARWFNEKYFPRREEYLCNSWSGGSVYPLLTVASFISMGDVATKEAFDWVSIRPKLLTSSGLIVRLTNDIRSKKEVKRGHDASAVQCYMKENKASKVEACEYLENLIRLAWKDINKDVLKPAALPFPFLMRTLNLARLAEVIYHHGDEFTRSAGRTKENIAKLLVHPILL
ncbi:PREDICTED: (-)-germacrene D synthase-like [Nelumbo nucifera]|uniref:(-)-germacrene D synthase-like n=1 Tax=Nelumbo nucifera TaxID=4432 RepID=A0A1U8QCZ3_NELNU|nr:PREDICTED: (-)-germacrene D synthase-like [Nelumbo nucifera]